MNTGYLSQCQICADKGLAPILSLGHQPPCHAHLTASKLKEPEATFPLGISFCPSCNLVQLNYTVDPKVVFYPEYPYFTGLTNMLIRNFRSLADTAINLYQLTNQDLVVDIGSNDGTLLKGFQEKGVRVLGVEPTNVAKVAQDNGVPTLNEFFTKDTVERIVSQHGKAKVVTAANVFAHIPAPIELAKNIKSLLTADGVFISESQYFLDTIQKLQFDCIYHEHLRYYSLKSLVKLFSFACMSVVDAEHIESAGGSIRVCAKAGKHSPSSRVHDLLREEEHASLYDIKHLRKFAQCVISAKHDLLALLLHCKKKGRIAGIGAPGRSNTLLGFAHIDNQLLDYLCERKGSPKIGLFTPGSHIPVVDEDILFREQPEFCLILAWHIGPELMKKLREKGYKGKFIMPLPKPHIVTEIKD